jgi:plastocyanin
MNLPKTGSYRIAALFTMISVMLAGTSAGLAQDATPSADSHSSQPAHIHAGTCAELGEVVLPLTDVSPDHLMSEDATPDVAGTPIAGEDMMMDVMTETSITNVDASLDDILAGEHALNIHESMENIGTNIACGDLTGAPDDGELTVTVGELNDSGYSGEAVLVDNRDGTTTVTVTLTSGTAGASSTPSANDSSEEAGSYEVLIEDFAYSPAELTIKVGDSVTFTNQDSAPHTATARDRDVLQTGRLGQGESMTVTFDTPGTYEYFCEFHPNMEGVIVVEE